MRRNSVVSNRTDTGFVPYGRIIRMLDGNRAEVIDEMKDVYICSVDDLEELAYTGFWEEHEPGGVWVPMPTLRKLKQMRAYFDKTIWKHRKKKLTLLDYLRIP